MEYGSRKTYNPSSPSAESGDLFEAERAILGGCLSNQDIYFKAVGELAPEDFASETNKIIFQDLIKEKEKDGNNASPSAFLEFLKSVKDLDRVGGIENIASLSSYETMFEDAQYYINIIKDKALARRFLAVIGKIQDDYGSKPVEDIPDFIGQAEKSILEVTSTRRVSDFMDIKQAIHSLDAQMKADQDLRKKLDIHQSYISGYPTGYESIDRISGGFHPGDLIILAARPSVGKTTLALNFAQRMAKANRSVGIFSLEMSPIQIVMKFLLMESGLTEGEIRNYSISDLLAGNRSDENSFALAKALDTLSGENVFIDSEQTLPNIIAKSKKLKRNHPDLSLIVIDYLGLISTGKVSKGDVSIQQQVSEITRSLKILARDIQVPIMVLCQLSRSVEGRNDHIPVLSDLRDSGTIEQDADMVFFIFRKDYYNGGGDKAGSYNKKKNFYHKDEEEEEPSSETQSVVQKDPSETMVYLRKNRSGRLGEAKFSFYKKYSRFEAIVDSSEVGDDEE